METHPKSSTWIERLWENISPILTITQREIVDTLRDWRLMFPIVVLVTLFPLLANFAADQGVKFINEYGGNLIAVRLFPFLMLVVGFFPSSFSLVIALESFVGEKERRSLEPLLAAPLTDLQLYLGKLLAATIPPVIGGYLGMLVYVVMLGLSNGWWPTPELLIVSFVLSTSEALVMVTAAVIISSQSTSVRAANLLSSFIIIPMSFLLQGEAGLLLFANYTGLWWIAIFLLTVNVMLIRLGVRLFDREHLLGRDLDMIDLVGAIQTFWDAFWPRAGMRALFTRDIPRQLREIRIELMLTAVVVTIGGLCVGLWGAQNYALPLTALNFQGKITAEAIRKAVEQSGWLHSLGVWPIFFNNVRSLVGAALIGVFSFGVLALLLLMAPLAVIAYVMLQVGQVGINPWVFFGVFVLPHGILELPAALIATAQVLRMGAIVLRPPEEGGGIMGMIRETGQFCRLFICIVAPLLLLAAWLESAITPWLVELAFG